MGFNPNAPLTVGEEVIYNNRDSGVVLQVLPDNKYKCRIITEGTVKPDISEKIIARDKLVSSYQKSRWSGVVDASTIPSWTALDNPFAPPHDPVPPPPKTYFISFKADGVLIQKVEFQKNASSIVEPPVPQKAGYIGRWAPYNLHNSNQTVVAIYSAT